MDSGWWWASVNTSWRVHNLRMLRNGLTAHGWFMDGTNNASRMVSGFMDGEQWWLMVFPDAWDCLDGLLGAAGDWDDMNPMLGKLIPTKFTLATKHKHWGCAWKCWVTMKPSSTIIQSHFNIFSPSPTTNQLRFCELSYYCCRSFCHSCQSKNVERITNKH